MHTKAPQKSRSQNGYGYATDSDSEAPKRSAGHMYKRCRNSGQRNSEVPQLSSTSNNGKHSAHLLPNTRAKCATAHTQPHNTSTHKLDRNLLFNFSEPLIADATMTTKKPQLKVMYRAVLAVRVTDELSHTTSALCTVSQEAGSSACRGLQLGHELLFRHIETNDVLVCLRVACTHVVVNDSAGAHTALGSTA